MTYLPEECVAGDVGRNSIEALPARGSRMAVSRVDDGHIAGMTVRKVPVQRQGRRRTFAAIKPAHWNPPHA